MAVEGDSSGAGDTSNTASVEVNNGAMVQVGSAGQINVHYDALTRLVGLSDTDLKDKLIASQEDRLAQYDELKKVHERQFHDLEAQLGKAQSVVPPLLVVITWLKQDRQRAAAKLADLTAKLDNVVNENELLRADFDKLTLYLSEVEFELARAQLASSEVHVEEGFGQRLAHAIRTRWYVYFPDRAEPDLPPRTRHVTRFALTAKPVGEAEALTYCRKLLDEIHALQTEVGKALEDLAEGVYKVDRDSPRNSTAEDDGSFDVLRDDQRKWALHRQEMESTRRKLREVTKSLADKEKKQRQLSSAEQATVRRAGTSGVLPGVGLFLAGVLVREVLKIQAPSPNERLVLIVLTAVLVGLPCLALTQWARSVERPAPAAATATAAFCVVAGYFCWVVVLVPALFALSAVVAPKKVGGEFALVVTAIAVFGIAVPHVVWWSWSGLDWFSTLF